MSRFSPRDWLPSGKTLAVVPPFAWLLVFLLVPFLLVFKISFAELQFGVPPYTPLAEFMTRRCSSACTCAATSCS